MKEQLKRAAHLTEEEQKAINFQVELDAHVARAADPVSYHDAAYRAERMTYYQEKGDLKALVEQYKTYQEQKKADAGNQWIHHLSRHIFENKSYK